jgi:hypothetical protein
LYTLIIFENIDPACRRQALSLTLSPQEKGYTASQIRGVVVNSQSAKSLSSGEGFRERSYFLRVII